MVPQFAQPGKPPGQVAPMPRPQSVGRLAVLRSFPSSRPPAGLANPPAQRRKARQLPHTPKDCARPRARHSQAQWRWGAAWLPAHRCRCVFRSQAPRRLHSVALSEPAALSRTRPLVGRIGGV